MKNAEIEEVLDKASSARRDVPAELLDRIAARIAPTMRPVRALPPTWVLTGGLVVISGAVALLGAARVGFQGIEALTAPARLLIFGTLALLACVAAAHLVSEWIPGSPRRLSAVSLLALVVIALLGLFALLFHDYRAERFLAAGLPCLSAGLLHAAPAALLGWWWLRRGWALDPVSAGLAAGVLGGIAGVTLLELHCTDFHPLHLLVWHTLVVPVSGALGAVIGLVLRERPLLG